MGRQRTGERLEAKSGPSMVLPLKAGRKEVVGEAISEEAISEKAIAEEAMVKEAMVDDEVIVEEVVMSDTTDGGACGGEAGTVSCSLVCKRMLNSRL